jgi:transposase
VAEVKERLRYGPDESLAENGGPGRAAVIPSRWTLARIQQAFAWLARYQTLSGLWRLLRRLKLRLRRGRPRQYSPDPHYRLKEQQLLALLRQVAASGGRQVILFVDEHTYAHWPVAARCWAAASGPAPLAQRALPGERHRRIVGGLNGLTGQLTYRQANSIGADTFKAFLRQVRRTYPDAEAIYLVVDNWSVHFCAEVTHLLETELPSLHLFALPTYSPWLNPIEKLWGWLEEYLLKMHPFAGQWDTIPAKVTHFLDWFAGPSPRLLHRVGLRGSGKLATALITDSHKQT